MPSGPLVTVGWSRGQDESRWCGRCADDQTSCVQINAPVKRAARRAQLQVAVAGLGDTDPRAGVGDRGGDVQSGEPRAQILTTGSRRTHGERFGCGADIKRPTGDNGDGGHI